MLNSKVPCLSNDKDVISLNRPIFSTVRLEETKVTAVSVNCFINRGVKICSICRREDEDEDERTEEEDKDDRLVVGVSGADSDDDLRMCADTEGVESTIVVEVSQEDKRISGTVPNSA